MIKFLGSFETVIALPNTHFDEYAFIGRSNVGKSSLINSVAKQKIARTSKTPGRTQSLNLFNFDDRTCIMDLPGYGYAKISKVDVARWLARLQEYLLNRRQLKRLFILLDSRVEIKQSDLELMDFCDVNGILYQIIFTKVDKKSSAKEKQELSHTNHPAMLEEILKTSAEKNIGIDSLRKIIGIK
jgi:GTP-binding protein